MSNLFKINHSNYQALIPALKQYRKELMKKAGLCSEDYYRIYTEKRTNGVRSKIYGLYVHRSGCPTIMSDIIDAMNAYILNTPTVTVDGIVYKVIVKRIKGTSIGIYFKAIAPSTPQETTQSTNQNTNNTNMNNTQSTGTTPSLFNESTCTASKCLYISGKMPVSSFVLQNAIPGLYVEYCGNAEMSKDGGISLDIIEWFFGIDKDQNPNSAFHSMKYADFKNVVEGIASSTYQSIAIFNQHITDQVYSCIRTEATTTFKPTITADPKSAVDVESIIKAFVVRLKDSIKHGCDHVNLEDVIGDIACDAASTIESDIDSIVSLSLDYSNQISIDVDHRQCENIVRDTAEEYVMKLVDSLDHIADDFLAENAQKKG